MKPNDPPLILYASQDGKCAKCDRVLAARTIIHLAEKRITCLACEGLASLLLLPSGDPAMTRRASKHSAVSRPVMEWSRRRKRFERRGTLVEAAAIELARAECAADAPDRAKKRENSAVTREQQDRAFTAWFADAVRAAFPGCPTDAADTIARHACEKHSGRVGRTAAAKEFDAKIVRLAVVAHIRHLYTEYDALLAANVKRDVARARILPTVNGIVARWKEPN